MPKQISITKFIWDKWNKEHIKIHKLKVKEIEEVRFSHFKTKETYEGRIMLFGQTKNKRLLTIVLAPKNSGKFYVVTARDMSKKERKLYQEK
ncbi:MAG: BrnT family toxin [Candidatus Cloacimonetes bacterium]|nr:BrnT family toxin [Candidatus Cloacimonadota bacterium]